MSLVNDLEKWLDKQGEGGSFSGGTVATATDTGFFTPTYGGNIKTKKNKKSSIDLLMQWLGKQAVVTTPRQGLIPKKIHETVTREGKTFSRDRIVWIRPSEKNVATKAKIEDVIKTWVDDPTSNLDDLAEMLSVYELEASEYKSLLSRALAIKNQPREKQAKERRDEETKMNDYVKGKFARFITKTFRGIELVTNLDVYASDELREDIRQAHGLYRDGTIYVNSFKSVEDIVLLGDEAFSKRTIWTTLAHEFGHHVYHNFLSEKQRNVWLHIYDEQRKKERQEYIYGSGEFKLFGPSYYSLRNDKEFFSEIFALAHTNKDSKYFTKYPEIASLLKEHNLW